MDRFEETGRPAVSARGRRFGIVVSRFNESVTRRLLEGAQGAFRKAGATRVETRWVPGAFEIPLALLKMARSRRFDALVALGAVIRGETPHFDYVCAEASRGVMDVMLQERVPVGFGILTTNNRRQALDRSGGRHGNKGAEAARVAVEMALLMR